jgi:hypothetical protein
MLIVFVYFSRHLLKIEIICSFNALLPKEFGKVLFINMCMVSDIEYSWQLLVDWVVNNLKRQGYFG